MSDTPKSRYLAELQRPDFQPDAAQELAIDHLDQLHSALIESHAKRYGSINFFSRFLKRQIHPVKGLYFWGGVGRGKTFLMDMFYDSLPFEEKMRTHFHRFMRRVHHELKLIENSKNPLEIVAEKLAGEVCVICFDEFFVSDITDAMILANLLDALFYRGVTLVATSNIEPQGLYKDGLQRARFLPAIDLLNEHTTVLNIDGGTDYRLRTLEKAQLYISPLGQNAETALEQFFQDLAPTAREGRKDVSIEIEGREIAAKKVVDDVLWLDFYAICDGPRSQNDYIEIAKEYHTVILESLRLRPYSNSMARGVWSLNSSVL